MNTWRRILGLSVAATALLSANVARAEVVGVLPPDLDYKKVCIKQESLQKDDFDWTGKTPATSGIADEKLIALAKLYYNGSGDTAPDYKRASDIVEYLLLKKGETRNEALFLKYDMLLKGRWFPQNTNMAKAILDELIRNNDAKAHSRYGDLYLDENNFTKAAEHYRKAFIAGEPTAAMALAYLYHDKKVPATQEEIDAMIVQAQNAAMQYLVRGNCHALTLFGLMYGRLNNVPKAEYYSAKWFEKAAELDEIAPKLYMANIIQRGYVVEFDQKRILKLWKEAAALGSDRAMFLLGEYTFLNHKNEDELKHATVWLEKSANRRNIKAMELLAALYDGRYPALKNLQKRQEWLEAALQSPDVKDKTIIELAALYETKPDIPKEKIFQLYEMAAGKGNNDAYLKLGEAYRYGLGVEASPAKALRYYRIAASNGESAAMESLAEAYQCGIGVEVNEEKSSFWQKQMDYYKSKSLLDKGYAAVLNPPTDAAALKKIQDNIALLAIAKEKPEAMVLLGLLTIKSDKDAGQDWLQKALAFDEKSKKDFAAHAVLGQIYLEGRYIAQDIDQGLKLLDRAATAGNASAHNELGQWFKEQGEFAKAEAHYKAAAAAGKTSALNKLAELRIKANDNTAALGYLEQAASLHDIAAMLKLAEGYQVDGWLGQPGAAKAKEWVEKATKGPPCKVSEITDVMTIYLEGKYGIEKNDTEAGKWLDKLGNMQPEDAEDALAVANAILSSSLGNDAGKRDKAVAMLTKLAENGESEAISRLAALYLDKNFSGYDANKALLWITKSAEGGDVASMMELANMYISGYGVKPSVETAKVWLTKAAQAGNKEAEQRLKNMKASP